MGHSTVRDLRIKQCVHHFDPNYRDHFTVRLERRTLLDTFCVSRGFTGNPGSDLRVTLIDDVLNEEKTIPFLNYSPTVSIGSEDSLSYHTDGLSF